MERLYRPIALEKIRKHTFPESKENYDYKIIASPVGPITLIASDKALLKLMWGQDLSALDVQSTTHDIKNRNSILTQTEAQLREYFSGSRTFFDLPLAPNGTEFQKRVWRELLKIEYGHYITYGEQAKRLGQANAARAVGAANGKNPIGIIIPCHRVLGASGDLVGFAGGLEIKRQLLSIEGVCLSK